MANLNDWQITTVKCFGKIEEGSTIHHLESTKDCWLFIYGETKNDEEGEHTIGSVAVVPSEYVKNGSFIGSDIRRFEVSATYGIHILANCRLINSIVL